MSPQKRIKLVNAAFLASMTIAVSMAFLPLGEIAKNAVLNILISEGMFALPFIVLLFLGGKDILKTLHFKKIRFTNVLLVILFGFLIRPLLTFFSALSLTFTTNETTEFVFDIVNRVPLLLALLFMAFIPALFEESIFRGFLAGSYKPSGAWRAVLLSAFLFALMHRNLNQFSYAFVLGIALVLLNEATDSLLASVIVHFMTNGLSTLLMYLLPKLYDAIKQFYDLYNDMGMTDLAARFEALIGDPSLTADEWMRMIIENSKYEGLSVGAVILTFLPSAVIFTTLAFLLLRVISKRSGTWNRFSTTYLFADEVIVEAEQKTPYEKEHESEDQKYDPTLRLMTTGLMIAIAIGIVFIFVYETLKLLPR